MIFSLFRIFRLFAMISMHKTPNAWYAETEIKCVIEATYFRYYFCYLKRKRLYSDFKQTTYINSSMKIARVN